MSTTGITLKIKQPGQRACDEKNAKGEMCCGHLKRWYTPDEETLKQIASMTDAKYYSASSAGELLSVFQNLPTYLISKHEVMEISVIFAALGALLIAIAIALSLRWHPLPF